MPFETRSRDRNQTIHTPRDTLEVSNNNAEHAAKFAQLGAAYAIELAKGTLGSAASTEVAQPAMEPAHTAQRRCGAARVATWKLLGMLLAAAALFGLTRRVG
jgi:hypothetical protein